MNPDQATKDQLYDQALTLFGNNQLDEAVVAFQEMIYAFPDEIEGYMGLAHACERAENYDGAIEAVKQAIELDPNDSLAYSSLSAFYQRKGMITEAEAAMAKSAELKISQSK